MKSIGLTMLFLLVFVFTMSFAIAEDAATPEVQNLKQTAPDSIGNKSMKVPEGFRAAADTTPEPYTNSGWAKEVIHIKSGIEMVFIPAGEFMMGSDDGFSNEKPVHKVRITKPFYMGKYEVTQGEWQKIMGSNPSWFEGSDRLPVETVSDYFKEYFLPYQKFISKAGDGLRLPTEAEWEYACRAGSSTSYHFGNNASDLANYAWFTKNSANKTHEVGQKKPNDWGLYDMHGNVWETCQDIYDDKYYSKSPADDPENTPKELRAPVIRGGSWGNSAGFCRSAVRLYNSAIRIYYYQWNTGFRVARTLE